MPEDHVRQPSEPASERGEILVGCAGWALRTEHAAAFPGEGSHLERYAGRLRAVEINSSFYRSHRPTTYARWAASVPPDFRFAVKVPRAISHQLRLERTAEVLDRFLSEVAALGDKRGPLLLQLPPSLAFHPRVAADFFAALRERAAGPVVCEPRHPTWFTPEATQLLLRSQVARAAVDPAVVPAAAEPAGWPGLVYYRLHGAPRIYYSTYSDADLRERAAALLRCAAAAPVWCIFDNTALGAATENALDLQQRIPAGR